MSTSMMSHEKSDDDTTSSRGGPIACSHTHLSVCRGLCASYRRHPWEGTKHLYKPVFVCWGIVTFSTAPWTGKWQGRDHSSLSKASHVSSLPLDRTRKFIHGNIALQGLAVVRTALCTFVRTLAMASRFWLGIRRIHFSIHGTNPFVCILFEDKPATSCTLRVVGLQGILHMV